MICRLCLKTIDDQNAVLLFNTQNDESTENQLVDMIANYLYIELSREDVISRHICCECSSKLQNFHDFWQLIEQKQGTLIMECRDIDCEVNLTTTCDSEQMKQHEYLKVQTVFKDEIVTTSRSSLESHGEHNECNDNVLNMNIKNEIDIDYEANIITYNDCEQMKQHEDLQVQSDFKAQTVTTSMSSPESNGEHIGCDSNVAGMNIKNEIDIDCEANGDFEQLKSHEEHKKCDNNNAEMNIKHLTRAEIHKKNELIVVNFMKLKCDICTKNKDMKQNEEQTFETFSLLREHFTAEHKAVPYIKCCKGLYYRLARLVEHVRWHQHPEEFTCTYCNRVMRTMINLRKHIKTHEEVENKCTEEQDNRLFACGNCEKKFSNKLHLKEHMLIHKPTTNSNPFDLNNTVVMIPITTTANQEYMNEEIKENASESHICHTCGLRYKDETYLQRHMLKHQTIFEEDTKPVILQQCFGNTKPMYCDDCGQACYTSATLNEHIHFVHRRKIFQCQYCQKIFKMKRYLEEHVATHTGEKLHTCNYCATQFRCKSNMYAHKKRKHYNEWKRDKQLKANNINNISTVRAAINAANTAAEATSASAKQS